MCKHHDMQYEIDRRKLLKALGSAGLAAHPLATLISSLLGGMAMAKDAPTEPRNYFHISLTNGPSRWFFDLLLHPFQDPANSAVFMPNGHVKTGFKAGQPDYMYFTKVIDDKTYYLPQLWASQIPRPGGGSVPMTDLLTNMMTIRGVVMGKDGHGGNRRLQILPLAGRGSLDGLVGDVSTKPLPSVSVDPNNAFLVDSFQSLKGIGHPVWDPNDLRNPLQQFLDAFKADQSLLDNPIYQKRQNMDGLIEKTLGVIDKYDLLRNPDTGRLVDSRHSAKKLLKSAMGDLKDSYNALFLKYMNLNTRSAVWDIPGVLDAPINGAGLADPIRTADIGGGFQVINNADLRTIITPNAAVSYLSEAFATAEFMLMNGYSSAITSAIGGLTYLNQQYGAGGVYPHHIVDEHRVGVAICVLNNTVYFRAIAACLFELITQLKSKGLFDNTVIHLASEFSRSAKNDGTGSDHGFNASVTSVFSGAVKKLTYLGNTSFWRDGPQAGTWGNGGLIEHDGSKENYLNIGHVTSTVADLLRVPRPMPNFSPVATEADDGVKPLIEEAKNV